MAKMILFDLDGTLTDSGEGIIKSATMALECLGIPVPSPEEMRSFVGPPLGDSFLKHGVPAERVAEAIEIFRSRYQPIGKYENHPYPGIRELLEALEADCAVRPSAFDASFSREQLAAFVLDSLLGQMSRGADNCEGLEQVLRRLLYC